MAPDLTCDSAQARMDDIAVDRLVERVKREAARHVDTHKADLRAEALAGAAADLRARAEAIRSSQGQNGDPLADAIWERCGRHQVPALTVDDPRTIAQVAYEAVADFLDRSAADLAGQHRTDPSVTELSRTEANHGD